MVKKLLIEITARSFLFGMIYSLLGALCKTFNLLPGFNSKNIIGAILGYSAVEASAFALRYNAEEKKQMARLLEQRGKN